jgi:glycine dehydrogenase subunit 1
MLARIGADDVNELFDQIPSELRLQAPLDLPPALSEPDLMHHLESLADKNQGSGMLSFLGAGVYAHHVPPVVASLVSRGEFLTAYTPYQAEASQGTLQAIFEFQTLVAQLTGMEVANASLYDGASAAAEAVLLARRWFAKKKRTRCLVSRGLHPQYRQVIQTYLAGLAEDADYQEVPLDDRGALDPEQLSAMLDEKVALVVAGYPNYLGVAEDLPRIVEITHGAGAIVASVTTEPVALGVLEAPGVIGADIAVAEGQALGIAPQFGGPGAGLFACKSQYMRQMPGRLVGQTADREGRRSFVLTLATREQHIRRERATSNICTNQGLVALAIAIYLSLVGRNGFSELARLCLSKATYLKKELAKLPQFELVHSGPSFNEFVLRAKGGDVESLLGRLQAEGIVAGVALAPDYPELADAFLLAVTERHRRADLDRLVSALQSI